MPSSWLANGKYALGNASTQPSPNTKTSKDWEMRPTTTPTTRSPGVTWSCDAPACAPRGAGGVVRVSLVGMASRGNAERNDGQTRHDVTRCAGTASRFVWMDALTQIKATVPKSRSLQGRSDSDGVS